MNSPTDLPRTQLMRHAQTILIKMGRGCVYFKFTCPKCGTRCTIEQPNTLYEQGECFSCGHISDITEGGYIYIINPPMEKK